MSRRPTLIRTSLALTAVMAAISCGTLSNLTRTIRAHPERVVWTEEPTVAAASPLLTADTARALADWRWGRFIGTGSCARADICVEHGFHEAGDGRTAGRAYFDRENHRCIAQIINHRYAVVVHEIGHCLGLAHSTDERSYMFHIARHAQWDPVGGEWHPVFITRADRAALRELMP